MTDAKQDDRKADAEAARKQQQAINPITGVIGPHDFDGTKPDEIRKLYKHEHRGNLPLGPGQVTGGGDITHVSANTAPKSPGGGDRTPGQGGNPPAKTTDAQQRAPAGASGIVGKDNSVTGTAGSSVQQTSGVQPAKT